MQSRVYETIVRPSVRPSVRLSVCLSHHAIAAAARGREISIDNGDARPPPAATPQHGAQQQTRSQLTYRPTKLNTDLYTHAVMAW